MRVATIESGFHVRSEAAVESAERGLAVLFRMFSDECIDFVPVMSDYILYVRYVFQSPFDLEARDAGTDELRDAVVKTQVLERKYAALLKQDISVPVDKVVQGAAGLRTLPTVGTAAGKTAAQIALPAV